MPTDAACKLGCFIISMWMMGFQNDGGQWQDSRMTDAMDIKIRVAIGVSWPTWIYDDFRGKIDEELTRVLFDLCNRKLRIGKLISMLQ